MRRGFRVWLVAISGALALPGCGGCRAQPDPQADAIKKVDEGLNAKDPKEREKAADKSAEIWEGKK